MVRGRVANGRAIAAADMAAGEADPEMQPLAALALAVLATVDGCRELVQRDFLEVGADLAHPTRAVRRARCWCTNCTAIAPSPTAEAMRFIEL